MSNNHQATADRFDSAELELLAEGMHRLRELKVTALAEVTAVAGLERFTPRDFGVPQIDALIEKLDVLQAQC